MEPVIHLSEGHTHVKSVLWCRPQLTKNLILTKLRMPSSFNIHVFTFEKVENLRREQAKTESNVETKQTLVRFKRKVNTLAVKNREKAPYGYDDDTVELADAYQAHNDPASDVGEEAPDYDDDEENDTFSSYVALDDVSVFEAAELDAIALLADTWDNDLDPVVGAHLVQANVLAYLTFGEEKGKGKGKGKGKFPVRPSCLPSVDRRQRQRELKAKTECRAFGRKGHWAHDRECAMTPSSLSSNTQTHAAHMTTQLHVSSQPKKVTTCFVLSDCSDDSETFANIAGQNVPLPTESTGQTLLTPMASSASTADDTRTESIFDVCGVDDDDEQG